jgi:hypothetical protein
MVEKVVLMWMNVKKLIKIVSLHETKKMEVLCVNVKLDLLWKKME